jgi:hypothetical protein
MSIASELGTIVALGLTLGRLGGHSNSIARYFHTRSIWQSHGVLSGQYLCFRFTSSFRNFERTILAAYQWLSDNYQSGDCIYLFGALKHYLDL